MRLELTKRGDYAVRAMLALTRGSGNGLLSARRIAEAEDIPVRFLPQVLADLQHAGLVEAAAGRTGGYRLARDAATVSLLDVIEAVEGHSRRQSCVLRGKPCGVDGNCAVHDVFVAGQEALRGTFARSTLEELAARADPATLTAAPSAMARADPAQPVVMPGSRMQADQLAQDDLEGQGQV
jgi:Rrf2 family transcriptional regulator, iron-sulfur cluster assembly transcription factor